MIGMETPLEQIPRVNRKILPALKRLKIRTAGDLLRHFPVRYEDFSNRKNLSEIREGETVTVQATIKKITTGRTAKKHLAITEALLEDETGSIKAVWFGQPFIARNLKVGSRANFSGKVALGKSGIFLQNPAYEKINASDQGAQALHTDGLVAIYPESAGISSRWLRFLIKSFLPLAAGMVDPLPEALRAERALPALHDAIRAIHFPRNAQEAAAARRRFAYEKLFFIQLRALKERARLKQYEAPEIPLDLALVKSFISSLPFALTNAQRKAIWEILRDMGRPRPMNRLLEGDVGSGKTVVAAAIALVAARAGWQTAFLAPTEILARQHFATMQKILAPFSIAVGLFTAAEKRAHRACAIAIGTHALLQRTVRFAKLGLVMIDEQHRFGVEQRATLMRRAQSASARAAPLIPHFLSLSATPIPRTLALAFYGDLDLSLLDEMPAARKPVITQIAVPGSREKIYRFIRDEIKRGRQAFVVCPRIEAGEPRFKETKKQTLPSQQRLLLAEVKSVEEEYEKLATHIFPDLKIGMIHGKMKPRKKEEVMQAFRNGTIDMLVATSVIEVGVDVPNATIMMIEGAERFGLAQLHQFRGRVGRGQEQAYCFVFSSEDGMVTRRLRALVAAKNGFELAEEDLKIRGPGDLFGTAQWGIADSLLAQALADRVFVEQVRRDAFDLARENPDLSRYPLLAAALAAWEETLHLE